LPPSRSGVGGGEPRRFGGAAGHGGRRLNSPRREKFPAAACWFPLPASVLMALQPCREQIFHPATPTEGCFYSRPRRFRVLLGCVHVGRGWMHPFLICPSCGVYKRVFLRVYKKLKHVCSAARICRQYFSIFPLQKIFFYISVRGCFMLFLKIDSCE
jgi:hypothetical protein